MMKLFIKSSYVLIIVILISVQTFYGQERRTIQTTEPQEEITPSDTVNVSRIFQCEAHPQILSNIPGFCTKCDAELSELILNDAITKLNEAGTKKPNLTVNYITKPNVDDAEAIADSSALSDSTAMPDSSTAVAILAGYDWEDLDHDGDGMLYQCPNDPLEFEDDNGSCFVCETPYEYKSVGAVKTALLVMSAQSHEEQASDSTSTQN